MPDPIFLEFTPYTQKLAFCDIKTQKNRDETLFSVLRLYFSGVINVL